MQLWSWSINFQPHVENRYQEHFLWHCPRVNVTETHQWEANIDSDYGLVPSGGCFTNVLWALQNILLKFVYCRNRTSYENFKLKPCLCAQSHALGTRTKFQLEILTIHVITGIVYFREIILESSRDVSETAPRHLIQICWPRSILP